MNTEEIQKLMPRARAKCKKHTPRRKFTCEEDMKIISLVVDYGMNNWEDIANIMVTRTARQCRERWCNYLAPDLRNDPWTKEEDNMLVSKFYEYGPKWVEISRFFNGRSQSSIKNRWYSHLKLKLIREISKKQEEPEKVDEPKKRCVHRIIIPSQNELYQPKMLSPKIFDLGFLLN